MCSCCSSTNSMVISLSDAKLITSFDKPVPRSHHKDWKRRRKKKRRRRSAKPSSNKLQKTAATCTIPPGKNYPLLLKYTNQVTKVKTVHLCTPIQLVKSYKPHAIAVKLTHTFQKTRHGKTQPCKLNRKSISDHTRQGHHQNSRVGRHKRCYTKWGNGGLTEAVSKSIQLWYYTTVYKGVTDESKKVKVKQKVTMQCFSAAVRPHYHLTLFHIIINAMHSF